jgi:molybdopterin-guanine dinucleotide biosynthesis protein A
MALHADVTGLVLAGGRSRRFGADKARHPVAGRPMIERVYAAVAPLVEAVLVSVAASGADYGLPAAHLPDAFPGAGPLAGLHAGLTVAATPWVLAVPCDVPFITTASLERLVSRRGAGVDAVVACGPDGRLQPLCGCYAVRTLPTLTAALAGGQHTVRAWLHRLKAVEVVTLPAAVLANINHPDDLGRRR